LTVLEGELAAAIHIDVERLKKVLMVCQRMNDYSSYDYYHEVSLTSAEYICGKETFQAAQP